jgi:hypothetical protein
VTEAGWLNITQIEPLLIYAAEHPRATPRRAGLFGCACCRSACEWRLPDQYIDAIETAERYLDRGAKRPTWTRYRNSLINHAPPRVYRWPGWDESFQQAVIDLFYPDAPWVAANSLLAAVGAISTVQYKAAFENQLCQLLRCIYGNPFRPVSFNPAWRTDTAVALARTMYDSREFSAMPILADALQDAGCEDEQVLNHCRDATAPHVRGCWVCDLVLSK